MPHVTEPAFDCECGALIELTDYQVSRVCVHCLKRVWAPSYVYARAGLASWIANRGRDSEDAPDDTTEDVPDDRYPISSGLSSMGGPRPRPSRSSQEDRWPRRRR